MSACRSCGASILWAETEKGKRIPLDDEPNEAGNVLLTRRGIALVFAGTPPLPGTRYMPHHATCPQGREWKR